MSDRGPIIATLHYDEYGHPNLVGWRIEFSDGNMYCGEATLSGLIARVEADIASGTMRRMGAR